MTTAPGQPPGAQASGSSASTSVKSNISILQLIRDSINLLIIAGGAIGLIVIIYTWTALGTSLSIKSFVTVGTITLSIALTCAKKLKKESQLSLAVVITSISIAITCICITIAISDLLKAQSPATKVTSSQAAAVRSTTIGFDQRDTSTNPIIVSCHTVIQVSGHVPSGYEFAIGAQIIGDKTSDDGPTFVPSTAESVTRVSSTTWRVPVTFGDDTDAGFSFKAYLAVIPVDELSFLIKEGHLMRAVVEHQLLQGNSLMKIEHDEAGQSWWISPGALPPPAFTRDTQVYQRSRAKNNCTHPQN